MEKKEGIIKKKIPQRSFLFSSNSSLNSSSPTQQQKNNKEEEKETQKIKKRQFFHKLDDLSLSLSLSHTITIERKKIKIIQESRSSFLYQKSQLEFSSLALIHDEILKKTITIESNMNIKEIITAFIHHQKYKINSLIRNDKYLQELYQFTGLWKFPSDQQINMISFLKNHHDLPTYTLQNDLLDTIWKIPKFQYDRYLSIIKEYFVLWEESLNSVCKLFFDSLVPIVYINGSSSSSCRIILSSNSNRFRAMIYSCPRGLYLKLIEMGILVTSLLETPPEDSLLPIASLSEKVIMIDGIVSIRLFIDALTTFYLPLRQSISSYQRFADNLPVILCPSNFDHSYLQTNTIDSYSDPLLSPLLSTTEIDSSIMTKEDNQEKSYQQLFQLTGYFTHHDIEFLCELIIKLSQQNLSPPRIDLSLTSKDIDHRVRTHTLQLNAVTDIISNQRDGEGKISLNLLNPFLITKSDPSETTNPTNVFPRVGEEKSNYPNFGDSLKHVSSSTSSSFHSKYFTMRLTSSPMDQMLCYSQNQNDLNSKYQQSQNDDLFVELANEKVDLSLDGSVITEIKWILRDRDRDEIDEMKGIDRIVKRNEDCESKEKKYLLELKYLPRCVPVVINYQRPVNQIVDEIGV